MRLAQDLNHEELVSVVSQIQSILYADYADVDVWNPNKEWDSETLEYVAAVLEDFGLVPTGREPIANV